MSDMKCPFCQQELVGEGSDNCWCKKCNLERHTPALYGSQELWQELIRTRKALNIAKDALYWIDETYQTCQELEADIWAAVQLTEEKITALEQKDIK